MWERRLAPKLLARRNAVSTGEHTNYQFESNEREGLDAAILVFLSAAMAGAFTGLHPPPPCFSQVVPAIKNHEKHTF